MPQNKLIKITSTFEFKTAVILSLAIVCVAAFNSQQLDYFSAASSGFMLMIGMLILIFLIVFLRNASIFIFNSQLYTYPALPFVLMLGALLFAIFFPFTKFYVDSDFKNNLIKRKEVVDKIYFREWRTDSNGDFKLPEGYYNLASDSMVRFCDDDKVITIVFVTFKQNIKASCIAYIEGLKDEKDIRKWISRKDQFPYYPIKYRKLAENWYAISCDKDFFNELN
ncbi:MAG: hypothetical protein A3K10_07980 [Bacteroidetes bacterium RIFCSPLOWO2_12_FULL_31_6]|nr:MAG: hypothetical protein A3K10_07980 [Bacteroidetes bacterium RIFCSPLOWO2_12_FULL_31_6]